MTICQVDNFVNLPSRPYSLLLVVPSSLTWDGFVVTCDADLSLCSLISCSLYRLLLTYLPVHRCLFDLMIYTCIVIHCCRRTYWIFEQIWPACSKLDARPYLEFQMPWILDPKNYTSLRFQRIFKCDQIHPVEWEPVS